MKKVTNELEFSVGVPSIRNKYKGAHGGKSKINYAVVKETTKKVSSSQSGPKVVSEEKTIIKKESQSSRIISGSPIESSSKITTKTVIQGGENGSSRQKITITKTETSESSKNSRALSGQKGKELVVSKRTETSTTTNNNQNVSQGGRIKQEITTKTTTTTTNQTGRGQSSGKQEIVKTVTNTLTESSGARGCSRGGKEEITTKTTTTTTNQRSGSQSQGGQRSEKTITQSQTQRQNTRGQSQGQKEQVVKEVTSTTSVNRRNEAGQKQVTTTKKVTTANTNQNKNILESSKTSQVNIAENKGRAGLRSSQLQQTTTTTKQRTLIAQKSTPTLRGNKEVTSNSTKKEKRALSSNTEINSTRDNITRITIDDTGKIPKKTYVLNVRKLDRIQQNKRQRLTYSSKLEETNPITTNFNHNIIVIKNVTRELPTLSDIGEDGKLIHKFAYTSKTNIPNTVRKVIDESGKKPKKKPVVSPRKNEIIKTIKKPFKFTYENYTETNNSFNAGVKKIPLPTTSKSIKGKINSGELKSSRTNETKTSRIKMEGNEKTMTTTTTTTTETKSRLGRNKSEANMNKGEEKGSKITITKTEISTENQGGRNGKLQISRSGRNITENSGSTTEKKVTKVRESSKGGNKVETVTTKQIVTQSSGKGRLGGESSGSKITTVKKTETTVSSQGDNSGRSRSRAKQETSSTTTTTTTKTVTKTSSSKEEAVQGGGVVKKFRAIKKVKK